MGSCAGRGAGDREVVTVLERCARFLHGGITVGNRAARSGKASWRHTRGLGGLQLRPRVAEGRNGVVERALRAGPRGGSAARALRLRVLCAFARVERVIEGGAVVALRDGVVRALQGILRGVEFVSGELIGAGSSRLVDCRLRLLQLFVGRIAAPRACQRGNDRQRQQDTTERRHLTSIRRKSTMKDLSPDDRPREKLLRHGAAALGDNELVALVIGSGSHGATALTVANDLLRAQGGLHGLTRCVCDDLVRIGGIGPARAAQIVAAVELGRRTLERAPAARMRIGSPREAAAVLMPRYGGKSVEQFGMLLLDTKHRLIRTAVIAVGTLNSSAVQPREVFREAAIAGAAAIVVFHNHPSGDPTPSPDDVELTERLAAAGALIGIDLVDHVILGDARYVSLHEWNRR